MESSGSRRVKSASCATALALALGALALDSGLAVAEEDPLVVRVLVLNFDPRVAAFGGERLHDVLRYNDPLLLSRQYNGDVAEASRDFVQYRVARWEDVDAYPPLEGATQWNEDTFLEAARKQQWPKVRTDYPRLIEEHGLADAVDTDEIDEVWLFGAPGFGFYESASVGPGAFYINGGVYDRVQVSRSFAIMGFSYERGAAEMLHDLAHRTENTMARAYGGWNYRYGSASAGEPRTAWDAFSASDLHGGVAGAGNCHWPANAENEYDYDNPAEVMSTADNWLSYPYLSGKLSPVSAESWGGPDFQRGYMKWWFRHLPAAPGVGRDGRLNNWWRYVFGFNLPSGLEPTEAPKRMTRIGRGQKQRPL